MFHLKANLKVGTRWSVPKLPVNVFSSRLLTQVHIHNTWCPSGDLTISLNWIIVTEPICKLELVAHMGATGHMWKMFSIFATVPPSNPATQYLQLSHPPTQQAHRTFAPAVHMWARALRQSCFQSSKLPTSSRSHPIYNNNNNNKQPLSQYFL